MKILDLREDRALIDRDFEGYKLSLEDISRYNLNLPLGLHRVLPGPDHYTYKHAKLFGLHNHLLGESVEEQNWIYYVDANRYINKLQVCRNARPAQLWKVPLVDPSRVFNISLGLPSQRYAVAADGSGSIYVVERDEWKTVYSHTFNFPFEIVDSLHTENSIQCLLYNIVFEGEAHKTQLTWIRLDLTENWSVAVTQSLKSKGEMYYAALIDAGLCVASQTSFLQAHDADESKKYKWSQTEDTITVRLKVREDVKVEIEAKELSVRCVGTAVLSGKFYSKIEKDLSTWSHNGDVLEMNLLKAQTGLVWPEVLIGNNDGELIRQEEVAPPTSSLLNTGEMEECDFPAAHSNTLEIITSSGELTHRMNLNSNAVLFSKRIESNIPSIAVHQNENACLWQPQDDGTVRHVGTLMAFGYVQASKQRKKFLTCSPDLAYSVVCEGSRHVFIYRQYKSVTGGELRNRTSGRRVKQIAQQQVVDLTEDEILGIHAFNNDEERVNRRFWDAAQLGFQLSQQHLSVEQIVSRLPIGPVIVLTNARLLTCGACKRSRTTGVLRRCPSLVSFAYQGHYIVVCGYRITRQLFYYSNPACDDLISDAPLGFYWFYNTPHQDIRRLHLAILLLHAHPGKIRNRRVNYFFNRRETYPVAAVKPTN